MNELPQVRPDAWGAILRRNSLACGAAALLGVLCYLNTLGGDFTYDDQSIVRNNERIRSLANLREIWLRDWWYDRLDGDIIDPSRDRLYRPLTMQSLALDYAIHGPRPFGFRLTNVLLHGACCALVFLLARRLLGDVRSAALAAALFALHPVHCEAIAQIVGRAEVLAALFLLLGLLTLLPTNGAPRAPGVGRTIAAAALFLPALLAKETAICYPLVALLALHGSLRAPRPPIRWWVLRAGLLLLPLLLYFPLRWNALEGHLIRRGALEPVLNPLFETTPFGRGVLPLTILGHYVRLIVAPATLTADYGMGVIPADPRLDAMTLLGALALPAWLLALRGYARRDGPGPLALTAGLTLASYLLISNTLLLIGVSVAERLAYWPSVPALLLVVVVLRSLWDKCCAPGGPLASSAGLLRVCGALLLVALGARTLTRNADWANDATLFAREARGGTRSVQLNTAHARILIYEASRASDPREIERLTREAEHHAQIALQGYARHAPAHKALGQLYGLRGQRELALQHLETARLLEPRDRETQRHLLEIRGEDTGRSAELRQLEQAVAAQPADAERRLVLGRALLAAGRHHAAREHLERAAELRPDSAETLRLLGQTLLLEKEEDRAVVVFERVLLLDPQDWETACNLAAAVAERDPHAALRYARQAHALNPRDLRTRVALGEALVLSGQRDAGLEQLRSALRGLRADDPFRAALQQRIENVERGRR